MDIYLQAKDYDNAEIYTDKACGLQVDEYSYDRGCALLNDIKRKNIQIQMIVVAGLR